MTRARELAKVSTAYETGGAFGHRNKIINGCMRFDQRNAGASVTPVSGEYTLDRWRPTLSVASKFSVQQNAGAVTSPIGFTNYLGVTSLSSYSVLTGDFFDLRQYIEGYNIADLAWGTANAKTVTLSFWVRSSLTGTFGGSLRNSGASRSYPFNYTISSANTWEQKSITIAGDTSGTWLTTNGAGIILTYGLGAGATYSGTAGSWQAGNLLSATGATSVVGTNGATFYITGVQLEAGRIATPFEMRQYGAELALCQRYYQTVCNFAGYGIATATVNGMVTAITPMRATASYGLTGAYSISDYYNSDYTQSSASITLYSGTIAGAAVGLDNFSGITAGRVYLSRFLNSNAVTMSAEL